MSLPLRITFDGKDYTYMVLTKGITKETDQIKISIAGEDFTLLRSPQNEWYVKEVAVGDQPGLLKAIARNVALRYRL
ncbi:hypothetical protein AB6735_24345 [Mucilaginibacter sp. RCC_168]|uniref:hypothetical protein n=1 Tax=Mucilaginibacter sp. RCC_168 TaxID=3239221 RepID=UPI0035265E1B